jgi:hypothetical protein
MTTQTERMTRSFLIDIGYTIQIRNNISMYSSNIVSRYQASP